MLAALINGSATTDATQALHVHAISVEDRGLFYGDGVFETMLLRGGEVRFIDRHFARLQRGCERLGIAAPSEAIFQGDVAALIKGHNDGVVKYIVTRGAGGRGYRAATTIPPTRVAMLYPPVERDAESGIAVRWCETRLARNARLAGIKHLNRLEQVLAQSEWSDPRIAEGLMMDTEGEVVGATAGNVFIVTDGLLVTPDLRFSGIRGVMRDAIVTWAQRNGVPAEERALWPDEVEKASEVFVCNAVRGIRPVVELAERRFHIGSTTKRLLSAF